MTTTEERTAPMLPTDAELDAMDRKALAAVSESHGFTAPARATANELRPWVQRLVHGAVVAAAESRRPDPVPEPAPVADSGAAELEPQPTHVIPEASRFQMIQQVAAYLAKSNLTPDALRGKPNDIGHILLKANDLGVPITSALDQIYVIHGRTGMEAKLMRTLIRRDGHSLEQPKCDGFRAVVHGRRADTGEEADGEFTLDDAVDFDLIAGWRAGDDNTFVVEPVRANGREPKPQWRKDTKNMLIERATSRLARWLFSECLAGVTYTPDELGYIEADGMEIQAPRGLAGESEPTMTDRQQKSEIARRIADLPDELRGDQGLRGEWKRRNLPKPEKLTPGGVRTALQLVERFEALAAERQAEDEGDVELAETPCPAPGCEVLVPGGDYCAEHAPPPEDDGTKEDADAGDEETRLRAEPTEGDTQQAEADGTLQWCTAKDGLIPSDEEPFRDAEGRPYHQDCKPF